LRGTERGERNWESGSGASFCVNRLQTTKHFTRLHSCSSSGFGFKIGSASCCFHHNRDSYKRGHRMGGLGFRIGG